MRVSATLGLVAGVLAFIFSITGYFVFLLAFSVFQILSGEDPPDPSPYVGLAWSGIFGSIFSIIGGVLTTRWRKFGVSMMIIGALLIMITLLFGFIFYFLNLLPFILLFVGIVYELKRRTHIEPRDLKRGRRATLQPIVVTSQMICHNCGSYNPLKTKICKVCGVRLYEEMPGPRCPVCLAPLKLASILAPGHIVCNFCFSEFRLRVSQFPSDQPAYSQRSPIGRKTKLAIAGLFVILLLVIIGLAAQQPSPTAPTAVTTQTPDKGSINNPAKVGESVKVRAYRASFEITVLDFIRGEEAHNKIKLANIFNPSPDPGHEYILVKVRVSYIEGDGTARIGMLNFKAIAGGAGYNPEYFIVYPDDMPELKSVQMIPGGSVEGWILFEVPADREVLISFSYLFSDPLCYIKLEKRGFAEL